jgi:small subunit ribosomal protein S1
MAQNDNQLEQGAMHEAPNAGHENEHNNMASLLAEEGLGIDFPKQGEIRTGIIASILPGQILVSVGAKSEGIISGREYEQIPAEERDALEVGQDVPVYIVNPEDQNGNLLLSYTLALEEVSWEQSEKLLDSKETHSSSIVGYNKGGLIVPVGRLRGFVPASQVSISRRANLTGDTPEQKWGKMVGEQIDVCVIEVDRERRRLILSERAASSETRESIKEKVIEELEVGEVRTGRVTSLADFGAFVNISGADGLVHLSELSWDRIQHPNEVLKVGQEVEVKVISVDQDKKRIGLSIRQLQEDPWSKRMETYQVGQLVECTITRLAKFGAFARLEDDIEGLIHISEISEKRIEHPKEVLHEEDIVTLRIIKIDPENHRIGLSLRRVESLQYADMDWETLLDEELPMTSSNDESSDDKSEAEPEPEPEAKAEPEAAPVVDAPSDSDAQEAEPEEEAPPVEEEK